jgi:hypothetical protein
VVVCNLQNLNFNTQFQFYWQRHEKWRAEGHLHIVTKETGTGLLR